MGQLSLHGCFAYMEMVSNFFVAGAAGNETCYLLLTRAQNGERAVKIFVRMHVEWGDFPEVLVDYIAFGLELFFLDQLCAG